MKRSKTDKRHERALSNLLEKGILATGLGTVCLMAPTFFESMSALKGVETGLRIPGLIALGVGFVLLGIRFSVQSRAKKRSAMPRYGDKTRTTQAGLKTQSLPTHADT